MLLGAQVERGILLLAHLCMLLSIIHTFGYLKKKKKFKKRRLDGEEKFRPLKSSPDSKCMYIVKTALDNCK